MDIKILLEAKKLIESGLSMTKASEKLKIDRHALSKELKLNNIQVNNKFKQEISEEKMQEMINLLNDGKSYKEIGEIVGLDRKRVSTELKKQGLSSIKTRGKDKTEIIRIYNEFIDSGLTLRKF